MNKGQLIAAIEGRLGGKKAAADALEAVLDVIIREVAKGRKVGITGFGTFERAARAARTGRNPRTGASVKIKKTAVPKFKAGTAFRTVVADPRQLPKSSAAGARASASTGTPAKAAVKKAVVKKTAPAKKVVVKKTVPAKKAVVKKVVVKKAVPAKKVVATKAVPAKKAAVKKAAVTLASAKKAAPAKASVKKAAVTLASAKKAAPAKKAPVKRAAKKA